MARKTSSLSYALYTDFRIMAQYGGTVLQRNHDEEDQTGVFKSVQALVDALMDFVEKHNENPKIFNWTKDADTILAKVAKCTQALGTGH
jgi:hypothetical protein